ncbi:MAG: hypothetical protein ACI4OI_07750, partial [Gemmiger sp.]
MIVLFLLQQSVFLTAQDTYTMDSGETKGFITSDAPWQHLLLFLAVGAGSVWMARHPFKAPHLARAVSWLFCAGMWLLLAWMVYGCRMQPLQDAKQVYIAALQVCGGNFSSFGRTGYIDLCPNQIGLLLYDMLWIGLLGDQAVIGIQLLNVGWLALSVVFLAKATALFLGASTNACRLLYGLYLPMGLYVTFMYGTLPGMAFSAMQFWCLARYEEDGGLRWCVGAGALGAVAALFKQNYLILSIAVMLYFCWEAIKRRTLRPLAAVLVLVALYAGVDGVSKGILYRMAGTTPGGGKPTSSWLALGMQDLDAMAGWIGHQEGDKVVELYETQGKAAVDDYCRQAIS